MCVSSLCYVLSVLTKCPASAAYGMSYRGYDCAASSPDVFRICVYAAPSPSTLFYTEYAHSTGSSSGCCL